MVETECFATAATLDAIGATQAGAVVRDGRTVLLYRVDGIAAAAGNAADGLKAAADAAAGLDSPVDAVRALLDETFVGRFATAFYTARRRGMRKARDAR